MCLDKHITEILQNSYSDFVVYENVFRVCSLMIILINKTISEILKLIYPQLF